MIQHNITILRKQDTTKRLTTLDLDLKEDREGDLPAQRWWGSVNMKLALVTYYLKGKVHRPNNNLAFIQWGSNGKVVMSHHFEYGSLK
jgi:hypothetical protein